MSDIKLKAPVRQDRVLLKDEDADVERKFTFAVLTRSRKKQIREIQKNLEELKLDDEPTDEQEAEAIRGLCDLISTLLVGGENSPTAGDMLYDAWVAEKITDDQIQDLLASLGESTADPT